MATSPYILTVREKIGHDLLLLPSVCVLVIGSDGRLLLVRNADTGEWQTIGGSVEPDEPPRDAAVREALEEAGVEVQLVGLVDVIGGPQFRLVYPNGDLTSYVSIVFEAAVSGGEPRPDGDETTEVAWWSLADLEQLPVAAFSRALLSWPSLALRLREVPR
ncbi:MAG TPA: NUDIX domain-containing protein [Acidimicrobiales bacterium]|nr:NUDIX domain-containing protein [Acidimicrobiales bacterium]